MGRSAGLDSSQLTCEIMPIERPQVLDRSHQAYSCLTIIGDFERAKVSKSMPNDSVYSRTRNHPRVCMIVTNDMTRDARVSRHADTLGREGYKVKVICRLSELTNPTESRGNYDIVRVHSKVAERAAAIDQRRARNTTEYDEEQVRFLSRRKSVSWVARFFLRAVRIILVQLALLREARRTRANIYCANDLDTLLLAVIAAGSDGRVIYDSHELWPDMLVGVPSFLKRILCAYERFLVKHTQLVMTVNEFIAKELAERYTIISPVRVVYNCPPSSFRKTGSPKKSERRTKVALYHGWYSPERGLENLVKASTNLLPDVTVLFRGAGILEERLRDLASGRSNVRFEPPVEATRVIEAAKGADVGIVPYLPTNLCNYYASPNKLFEYLEAGLPIAASNLPFMRKVIIENEIGTLFDARDPNSIAEALNLITRSDQSAKFRKNIAAAREKYSWSRESRKLLETYAELL